MSKADFPTGAGFQASSFETAKTEGGEGGEHEMLQK